MSTADDAHALGCIDALVPEPAGGAHLDPDGAAALLSSKLGEHLSQLRSLSTDQLLAQRYAKFRGIAPFYA
jgi:acetyl-CoA carboxylase carboxyl transferase subunit alpha